jgi:hypothetical protein
MHPLGFGSNRTLSHVIAVVGFKRWMVAIMSNVHPGQSDVEGNGVGCVVPVTMISEGSGIPPTGAIVPITREQREVRGVGIGVLFVLFLLL